MTMLSNQVAVVTGTEDAVGRAIALKLAEAGADVVCLSQTAETAEKVAGEVRDLGRNAWAFPLDLADAAAVTEMSAKILAEAGRVDILVNNAGALRDELLDPHVKGAFVFTKTLARTFLKQRSGRILNVAPAVDLSSGPGQSGYAASKGAVIGLTKSVARELGSRGVTANVLVPGYVEVEGSGLEEGKRAELVQKIPLNSLGKPEDVAGAALFLASPAGRYITGQTLMVDGGMVM